MENNTPATDTPSQPGWARQFNRYSMEGIYRAGQASMGLSVALIPVATVVTGAMTGSAVIGLGVGVMSTIVAIPCGVASSLPMIVGGVFRDQKPKWDTSQAKKSAKYLGVVFGAVVGLAPLGYVLEGFNEIGSGCKGGCSGPTIRMPWHDKAPQLTPPSIPR